jgi:hypothetical protein
VSRIAERARCRIEGLPTALLLEGPLDGLADEGAPATRTGDGVELMDQGVVELNVHTHVLMMTHTDS